MAIQERGDAGTVRRVDTLIIGAGQAGLATAHQLQRRGADSLVIDGEHRVGDNWRHRYDSLRLFTPNRLNGLPGMRFPGDASAFPGKDEVGDYLEAYAGTLERPVELDCPVRRLRRHRDGFLAETAGGTIECRSVVIATGTFGLVPSLPAAAADLDPAILQLHASEYRRPDQLPDGPVLVVGGGHSGCDIALEVAKTHPTTLVGRDPGEIPVPWDSPMVQVATLLVMSAYRWLHRRHAPHGRRLRAHVMQHGAAMLRVKRAHLAAAGVVRETARFAGARKGSPALEALPMLDDGTVIDADTVIWATRCRHDYSWLELPVVDEHDWPREHDGVADDVDGLYFCGLAFQHTMASMVLFGVGADASYIAKRIVDRQRGGRDAPREAVRAV